MKLKTTGPAGYADFSIMLKEAGGADEIADRLEKAGFTVEQVVDDQFIDGKMATSESRPSPDELAAVVGERLQKVTIFAPVAYHYED